MDDSVRFELLFAEISVYRLWRAVALEESFRGIWYRPQWRNVNKEKVNSDEDNENTMQPGIGIVVNEEQ